MLQIDLRSKLFVTGAAAQHLLLLGLKAPAINGFASQILLQ